MTRLGEHFYGFSGLAEPLSEAMFKDSTHLPSHQFSVLLNISRCIIDDCPVRFRDNFLPPMIAGLFTNVDRKVTTEWDLIERRKTGLSDGDLTEEMKSESILRQLTYSAVIMVASLLDPQRIGKNLSPGHQISVACFYLVKRQHLSLTAIIWMRRRRWNPICRPSGRTNATYSA